jgi:hypothetical protein
MLEPEIVMNWTFQADHTVEGPTFFSMGGNPCNTHEIDPRHYQVICEGGPFEGGRTKTPQLEFSWLIGPPDQSGVKRQAWTYTWSFPGSGVIGRSNTASGTGEVTVCSPPGPNCSAPVS